MKSIRGRLLAVMLVGMSVVLILGGASVYWLERSSLTAQFDAALQSRAHTLASLVKLEPQGLIFESGDAPPEVIDDTYFEIRNQVGKVLKRSDKLEETSLPWREQHEDEYSFDDQRLPGEIDGRTVWHAFRPRVDLDDWGPEAIEQARPPLLTVIAALDREPVDRALATLAGALGLVGAVAWLTAAVLCIVGVRWGLRPLDRLRRQLSNVRGETISARLDDAESPRELAPVYGELNRMLDRVESVIDRERSFTDAAAHEFRTPLAELRAAAEVAIRWPDHDRTLAALREVLHIGLDMERLIESLLLISRAKVGVDSGDDPVQAAALVRACLEGSRATLDEKRLAVRVEPFNGVNFTGAAVGMEIILRNLIDNAVHYTPAGGTITIRPDHNVSAAQKLIIENGPVDLAAEDVQRIFEPFWRTDRARTDRSHVGLGLTVVKRVAEAVRMQVNARLDGDRLVIELSQ